MEQETKLTFPARFNLFDMVSVKPYKSSPEYNEANRRFQIAAKAQKTAKLVVNIILWLALAAFLLYLYFTGHTFLVWVAGIVGAIICGIISSANSPGNVSTDLSTLKEDEETCKKIIDELRSNLFTESRYIYSWRKALIYNNSGFAYMSFDEALLVIYNRCNLKEIRWYEVEGRSYGDQYDFVQHGNSVSMVYKGMGYNKETRIEVYTDYMEYPVIKFNVPATNDFIEQIKIAGSILS